jgi:deazaflavin-dependent oxidoreductase (nitroreductase family)
MEDDWKLVKLGSEQFIYLTTKGRRTGRPHRVELWFAANAGKVYLSHEGDDTDWMKNMKRNPEVNFQIGKENFSGRGRFLQANNDESTPVKMALYEKYYGKAKKETVDDWFSLSKLIEIEPI